MSIEYNVLNILKEHSSKEAAITLKVTDIVTYMHKDYDKSITDKQVRKALKDLTDSEFNLPDEQKIIRYRTYDNERRKTDYYYNNIITDVEFKFLIDSVLYSNGFSRADSDFIRQESERYNTLCKCFFRADQICTEYRCSGKLPAYN